MRKLAAVPVSTLSDAAAQFAGLARPSVSPEAALTLAPDGVPAGFAAGPQHGEEGPDGTVPLVGYLVLAPAGTQLSQLTELLSPTEPDGDGEPPEPLRLADAAGDPEPPPASSGLDIDLDRRTVSVDGRTLRLTYLEFELLAHLVRHPHRVYTREQLVATIWGYGPVGEQRTVDVHIARLRRKLGVAYRERIVTVRRVGYKYVPAARAGR
ncbi:winged helix-turn-helix domain-containing protein [Streptomyces sp. 4N509B]|uniref:winged helix-turn-helix domain-containing protein n=1 Tax=Streptomyces sp. 4N509B TaxID=3457413 RepID=UPI003FD308BA